jgi:tetratricopeptide (TPR) repeat protein
MDGLVADLGARPMLVIGCYRPVFSHKWPETVKPTFVEVKELSDHDSRRLLFELLGVSSLPAGMVQDILNRTRGNPFFIEELIHAFMDSGILVQRGQKWEFTREIKASEIPDTLRHVILARIDSLEVRLRRILQCASVIGRGFRYEILEYITDFQARLDSYVHELVDVHFLIEQSLLAELLYLFRHAVARDVTYETLLRRRRFEFHRKVGECIESLNANQLERHYEFLAHHFYHSDNPQKAAFYLERASDKLERLYANEAAIESLNRLLETLDKLPKSSEYGRLRAEALIRLGRIQKLIGEYEPSVAAYRNAIRVAERLSDGEDLAAKARRNLADVERLLGRHDKALRHLDLAGKTWERLGDAKSGLTVHNSRGVVFMAQGKYAQAAKAFREGVELARRAGTLPSLANALNDLGIACLHAARYDEALQTFTEALGRMEELADKKGMVACLNNLGMCHERLGQFGEALKFYGRSFELAEKIGHRYALLGSLINIGQCYQYQGDFRSAIRQFRRVVKLTDAQPNAYAASVARGNLATNLLFMDKDGDDVRKQLDEAYRLARASRNHLALINAALAEVLYLTRQQQYGKAERLARTTIEDIEKRGYADYQALAYRYLADALLGRKQAAEARRAVERSLRLADKAQSPRDRAWALWMRARVEQTAGRESAARSSAREARRLAERIGDKALLELAQSQ